MTGFGAARCKWCASHTLQLAGWLGGGLQLALVIGFLWFAAEAAKPADAPAHSDGMVVLTGGAERVETGLRLLAAGRAERLLLSGVARGAELPGLAHLAGVDAAALSPRVTVGHAAGTTRGNAAETAAWARRYDIRTLIVVTGFYHMPRALAELSRTMPDVTLYRLPVVPGPLRNARLAGLRLLGGEYLKFLVVQTRLASLLPPDRGQTQLQPAGGPV